MWNRVQCDECRKYKCECKPDKEYCQHCGCSYNRIAFDDCPTCAALDDEQSPKPEDEMIDCPDCPNQGWYFGGRTEPEQIQCQFCYTVENSVFYVTNNLGG